MRAMDDFGNRFSTVARTVSSSIHLQANSQSRSHGVCLLRFRVHRARGAADRRSPPSPSPGTCGVAFRERVGEARGQVEQDSPRVRRHRGRVRAGSLRGGGVTRRQHRQHALGIASCAPTRAIQAGTVA